MDDQPRIVPSPAALPSASDPLHTEEFVVPHNPSPNDIVQTLAHLAQFMNLFAAECLRSKVVSAANPATAALMNASAAVEQGGIQLLQLIRQQQQGAFAGPGAGPQGAPQGPGPFRMN